LLADPDARLARADVARDALIGDEVNPRVRVHRGLLLRHHAFTMTDRSRNVKRRTRNIVP